MKTTVKTREEFKRVLDQSSIGDIIHYNDKDYIVKEDE